MKKLALVSLALVGFGLTAVGCVSKETAEPTETTTQVAQQLTESQQHAVTADASTTPHVDLQDQAAIAATDPTAQVTPAQQAPITDEAQAQNDQ